MPKPIKILFVASECAPFAKTGGLADVAGALPKALAQLGMDVRVILPLYAAIGAKYRARMEKICEFTVTLGWRSQSCGIYTLCDGGPTYYFVENPFYFGRNYIYGASSNDEGERFAFFSKAVLEAMGQIGFFPHILHANDWQAAMSVALVRLQYAALPDYRKIKTVFTIHNLRYQGVFEWPFMDELLSIGGEYFTEDKLEYYGQINFMKAALLYADLITTVSPTYAQEIQTPQYGETLDGVLSARRDSLFGILNGIDEALSDPSADPALSVNFSAERPEGKAACKVALAEELGLRPDWPMLGMVTRLTEQKGLDLVEEAMDALMRREVCLAVLGSGEARYEEMFAAWANRYPGWVAIRCGYDEALASRIYAGADFFLMPSRYEPCGLAQLIALRYGAIPIVRETGGLRDSIIPYNRYTSEGLGFSFAQYSAQDMLAAVDRGLEAYYGEGFPTLVKRAMEAHFTWGDSAQKYAALYKKLKKR